MDHVGDQTLGPLPGAERLHHGGAHALAVRDRRFDLTEFDAVSLHLDLVVLAAEELDHAVRPVTAQVAGAVEPLAGGRVPDERGARLLPVGVVTAGQALAADVELAGHPGRARAQLLVEHVELLIAHRRAVRDARPLRVDALDRVPDRPDRRLGRAAQAPRRRAGQHAPDQLRQGHRDPVAAHHHDADLVRRPRGRRGKVLGEQLHQGRDAVPDRHAVFADEFGPPGRFVRGVRLGQHDRAAGGEHAEHVVDGQVEVERGQGQHAVPVGDGEAVVDVRDGVAGRPVLDHHPLGGAGAAGGEDDVRQVSRVRGGRRGRRAGERGERVVVDHEPFHAFGPGLTGRPAGLGERQGDAGGLAQRAEPFGRDRGVDRHVGGARLEDAECAGDLLPALVHHHADQLLGGGAAVEQPVPDPVRQGVEFTVGEAAVGRDHGGPLGPFGRVGEEPGVQQPLGPGAGGGVDAVAHGEVLLAQEGGDRTVPGRGRGGQLVEEADVGGVHRVDQAGREELFHHVPVDDQLSVVLDHLVVEPHLRGADGAGDLVSAVAEGEQVLDQADTRSARVTGGEVHRACEHDRYGRAH